MKKLFNSAFIYLLAALGSGILWREITKIMDISEPTALGTVHTHLFALGFMMFMIFILLEKNFHVSEAPKFKVFYILYHIGVILTATFMFVRGMTSMLVINGTLEMSNGLDSAISGMSGMGHTILTVALIIYMFMLKNKAVPED
ncbi:DUF2871 domain-containing protein [Bacillus sp. AGMB 02131]|uniref:DUF2871 domain-containing protein n=1 Tax=Peribacillus faecalis TaxID=2772559 RepID=A0A927HAY3_9BACI|nr:DUF2871 domain-containing protein [Peribacillus faecalis]MBD3108022.1 DUF2871 domain-containing protein [Peribacillus faecalis]